MPRIIPNRGRSSSKVVPLDEDDEDQNQKRSLSHDEDDDDSLNKPSAGAVASHREQRLKHFHANTGFKQQRLRACRPAVDPHTMTGVFLVLGGVLLAGGVVLYYKTGLTTEFNFDYTHCNDSVLGKCSKIVGPDPLRQSNNTECVCSVNFNLTKTFHGQFYMFYELRNFYQNHRHYVRDVDKLQLYGTIKNHHEIDGYCREPYIKNIQKEMYWPCGRIANSMFSDKFELTYIADPNSIPQKQIVVPLQKEGIAWRSDKRNFKNPKAKWNTTIARDFKSSSGHKLAKPLSWKESRWDEMNDGLQDEDFIVWMRIAALSRFRKLYRIIRHRGVFKSGLPNGSYVIRINYSFPVTSFYGSKKVVIATTSEFGGRTRIVAYAYIGLGGTTIFFGFIFSILYCYEKYHFRNLETRSNA